MYILIANFCLLAKIKYFALVFIGEKFDFLFYERKKQI